MIEAVLPALPAPGSLGRRDGFCWLSGHPDTAARTQEVVRDNPGEIRAEPSETDPSSR
jgi:hypothetical protein